MKGLKEGEHSYHFEVNDTFFDEFDISEIKKGNLKIHVILAKQISVITLTFKINGFVNVTCDRCLENFNLKINSSTRLYLKYSENEVDDDEVIYISENKHSINIAQYIYEFIDFSLPLKRIHPEDNEGKNTCNIEMINKLKKLNSEGSEMIDPRWEELKKLKK